MLDATLVTTVIGSLDLSLSRLFTALNLGNYNIAKSVVLYLIGSILFLIRDFSFGRSGSFGKDLLNLKVVSLTTGKAPTTSQFVKNFCKYFFFIFFIFLYFFLFFFIIFLKKK